MKLYTEEQLKDAFIRGILKGMSGSTISTDELFKMYISEQTPIEIPSDEETEEYIKSRYSFGLSELVFKEGAKWMKEQILVNPNPKGTDTWKELYERYKLSEAENKELREYRDRIEKGNKQYFNSTVPLK